MQPKELFCYCPRCGITLSPGNCPLVCTSCQFVFYFNPTVSAAAYVFDSRHRAIFLRRAKEPAKGKLTVPGGFIDFGETAEEALRREVREEVGLEIQEIRYLLSLPNLYLYKGVEYSVCDLVFQARAVDPHLARPLDGATAIEWHELASLDPQELAFPSVRQAWKQLLSTQI